MHPNYCQIIILLVVDICLSLAYFMMIQPLPIAGKLPIKTLVAKQLPTCSVCVCVCVYMYKWHNNYNICMHDYACLCMHTLIFVGINVHNNA